MQEYTVSLEISGPTAMWTRPDTGDTPVSYPVPTFGAVKGIFECILMSDWAEVVPARDRAMDRQRGTQPERPRRAHRRARPSAG